LPQLEWKSTGLRSRAFLLPVSPVANDSGLDKVGPRCPKTAKPSLTVHRLFSLTFFVENSNLLTNADLLIWSIPLIVKKLH
jgi:hypothetical protein